MKRGQQLPLRLVYKIKDYVYKKHPVECLASYPLFILQTNTHRVSSMFPDTEPSLGIQR